MFHRQPALFPFFKHFHDTIDVILIRMCEHHRFQTGNALLFQVWQDHIRSHLFLAGASPVKQKCLSTTL